MNSGNFLTYEELVADLRDVSKWHATVETHPVSVSAVVGLHGQVCFRDFLVNKKPAELVLPDPPKLENVVVGARVILLSLPTYKEIDVYPCTTMIIVAVDGDYVEGYVFNRSAQCNYRLKVSRSQIIDCAPPLGLDWDQGNLVFGELPF